MCNINCTENKKRFSNEKFFALLCARVMRRQKGHMNIKNSEKNDTEVRFALKNLSGWRILLKQNMVVIENVNDKGCK